MIIDNLWQDLQEFTGMKPMELNKMLEKAPKLTLENWKKIKPVLPEEKINFYALYSYELFEGAKRHLDDSRKVWIIELIRTAKDEGWKVVLDFGCLPKGSPIIMGDLTMRNIEEIQPGDKVLGHDGQPHVVDLVHKRSFGSFLMGLKIMGRPSIFWATPEHPFLAIKASDARCPRHPSSRRQGYYCRQRGHKHSQVKPQYIPISALEPGDYVAFPIPETVERPIPFGRLIKVNIRKSREVPLDMEPSSDFGFFIGMFLAEGSYLKAHNRIVGLRFSVGLKEVEVLQRLAELAQKFWQIPGSIYERSRRNIAELTLCHKRLALAIWWLVGEGAERKHLHPSFYHTGRAFKLGLLSGYLKGDGHLKVRKKLCAYYEAKSASETLIRELAYLTLTLGVYARINRDKKGFIYRITGQDIEELFGGDFIERPTATYWKDDEYIYVPIKEIISKPILQKAEVYNLTVHDCHSYILDGLAIHNCGIGTDGLALAEAGLEAHFLDVVNGAFNFARWRAAKYGLSKTRFYPLQPVGQKYDCIICVDVLGHTASPTATLEHLMSWTDNLWLLDNIHEGHEEYHEDVAPVMDLLTLRHFNQVRPHLWRRSEAIARRA